MRYALLVCFVFALGTVDAGVYDDTIILQRGDANDDGVVNQADPVFINSYLYSGGSAPPCMNQADANKDGRVDVSDSVYLLNWLYQGGPAPPAPGPFNTTCTTTAPYISCASGC